MKKQKIDLKSSKLKNLTRDLVKESQRKGLIKPISAAFKDIPASDEIHKGKKEYFY